MKFDNIPPQTIEELGHILRANDFSQGVVENRLQYKFGGWLSAFAPTFLFPLFALKLSTDKPLDVLLRFFYCCYPVSTKKMRRVLGSRLFKDVCNYGLAKVFGDMVESTIQIIPFYDLVISTERPKQGKNRVQYLSFEHNAVMTLFPDSYDLAKRIKSMKAESVLDIFCGNGVQALTVAKNADRIVGVDINNQALEFARFNARLNGLCNVKFEYCDVNKSIAHLGQFDVIIANPPFCPAVKQRTLFCDGGLYGDDFVKLLLEKRLAEVVKKCGKAYIIFPLAIKRGESAKSRFESYRSNELEYKATLVDLGKSSTAINSLHNFLVYFLASRNINNLSCYTSELEEYYDHFNKLEIEDIIYNILELTDICLK